MQESEDEALPPESVVSDLENATMIRVHEAPPNKQEKFRRFQKKNRGTWDQSNVENKEVTHRRDNLRRYDAISSNLELTPYQKKRGRELVDEIDLEPYSLDLVIFAVCVLLVNDDVRKGNRYYPNESAEDDRLFEEMGDTLCFSQRRQASMVESLRQKVDL